LNTVEDNDEYNVSDLEWTMEDSEEFDNVCRELTSMDVDQALYTLKMNQKRTISSDNETSIVSPEQGKSFFNKTKTKIFDTKNKNNDFLLFK